MRLARADKVVEDCEAHLHSTGAWSTEIERLLTYSLLVIIYAEFEQKIKDILQEKCNSIDDDSIRELAWSCIGNISGRIQSIDMADLLKRFGDKHREAFRGTINASRDNQRAESSYNNLIRNRHETAHSTGTTVTFQEVKTFYREGHVVLDFFRDTLLAFGAGSG